MIDDQVKVILDRLDALQKTVDRIDTDLTQDRHDLQESAIRLGKLEVEIEQLRSSVQRLPDMTANRVEDAVGPIKQEAHNLTKTIEKKRVIEIEARGFFKKLAHWWSQGWQ